MGKESIDDAREREKLIENQKDISKTFDVAWGDKQGALEKEVRREKMSLGNRLFEKISDKFIGLDDSKERKKSRDERIKSLQKSYKENLEKIRLRTDDFKREAGELIDSRALSSGEVEKDGEETSSEEIKSKKNEEKEFTEKELEAIKELLIVMDDGRKRGLISLLKDIGLEAKLRKEIEDAEREIAQNEQKEN